MAEASNWRACRIWKPSTQFAGLVVYCVLILTPAARAEVVYQTIHLSSNACLTMNPAGVSVTVYAGITIEGVVGLTYGIQCNTNLSNTNG
jgi:hypothetical protein